MDVEEKIDHLARVMERGFDTLADLQRETNQRLDQTNQRLDQTNQRLDRTNQRLDRHEEILVKLADGMLALSSGMRELSGEMKGLNNRFDNFLTGTHREDHEALRHRVERIERHVGLAPVD